MDRPIELIPLVCPKCSTPAPAGPEECAWACSQCGQGMALTERWGLQPLEIHYASTIPANAVGRPFWVGLGEVTLSRESYDRGHKQSSEAQIFWGSPRRFFIPAYELTLEELINQAARLVQQPPVLQEGPPGRFAPVVLPPDELQATAEFIVMAIEAERKDKLKKVEFQLALRHPDLWILP